ncbi:MAG: hypothetical protein KatS3mg097_007 [Candidatus Parcubacteria bacterium]|nr:MAG: hypothetical protein KatS3mg097_007 [Candidatus Parcubacteria bacterium]
MLIKVKVFPSSKEEKIVKKAEDSFEVKVKERAERGLANMAVIRILASYFKIPVSQVRLLKGAKSKNKIFEIKLK